MRKFITSGLKSLLLAAAGTALFSFPAWAFSIRGEITQVDAGGVSGWAWNKEDTNDVQTVEVHILEAGNPEPIKYLKTAADNFSQSLEDEINDGWHCFSVDVDWSTLEGQDFKVRAYAVKDGKYYTLGDTISYSKSSGSSAKAASSAASSAKASSAKASSSGSAAASSTAAASSQTAKASSSGLTSLGVFTTSGYCGCPDCSKGNNLTYAGTVPQEGRTISADLNLLPLGTKVMIDGVVYTVEDTGSNVEGNWIDIYYSSHDSAWAHGLKQQEVFLVQ